MAKVIKLGKKDDLVSVIQQIKKLKDKEIIFELEKGSSLLSSSANLKLLKRTGETLNKKISVTTTDRIGRLLAIKAGVLADQTDDDLKNLAPRKSGPNPQKRIFADLGSKRPRVLPPATISELKSIKPKKLNRRTLKISAYAAAAILVAAAIIGVVLPRANITIYARSETLNRDLDLKVDQAATATNLGSMTIPGKLFTKEVSETQNFRSSGTSFLGSKAAGKVLIYNGTSNTLTLRASTTTLESSGKKYFFTKDVTGIKPSSAQNNPNTPVDVVAEQAGDSYNLAAGVKLTISNAALGNRPEVYAVVSDAISGGSATAKTVVSQEDLDKALEKITSDLIANVEKELDSQTPGTKLIASGVEKEILAHTANKNAGDESDSFDLTVIARIKGLTFNQQDVVSLLDQQINSVLADDKYIVEGGRKTAQTEFKDKDLNLGKGTLAVKYGTVVAYKVDAGNLARILAGKRSSEIKEILLSRPEVEQVDVKLWPFFARKAPRYNGKIYITTVLSQL
ncbi:MAG: hypothetical protein HY395_00725 [Candidatus Doudnabacteria bacterium]|nr:hypothetical protein [Candidatus Doudnabacteria bacterium]